MSFGIRCWDSSGVMTFDSLSAVGGVTVDIVSTQGSLSVSSTVTRTYPEHAGRTIEVVDVSGWNFEPVTWSASSDYALGHPRVVFTLPAGGRWFLFVVLVK